MAKDESKKAKNVNYAQKGGGNAVYFFGMVGALVYFVQAASGFGEVIVAILKAIVWPAFLVYDLFEFLS